MTGSFPGCCAPAVSGARARLTARTTASPISRMDTSVEDGWRESSRTPRGAPPARCRRLRVGVGYVGRARRETTRMGDVTPNVSLRLCNRCVYVTESDRRSLLVGQSPKCKPLLSLPNSEPTQQTLQTRPVSPSVRLEVSAIALSCKWRGRCTQTAWGRCSFHSVIGPFSG